MLRPRLQLCLLLIFVQQTRLFVGGHLFSWLLDSQTVCEPDFLQCPNGGLAFRDRNHNCEFTPCELIPDPPLPPPPPSPKTLPVHEWFGRHEFIVPTFNVAALQRGKIVERDWAKLLESKRLHPTRRNFSLTVDMYIVAPPPPDEMISVAYAANAHDLHLDALVGSQAELFKEDSGASQAGVGLVTSTISATAQMLAVSKIPWTRWEFFGQLFASKVSPSFASVETALRLLNNASSTGENAIMFLTLVIESSSDKNTMTRLLKRCATALTTLVPEDSSVSSVLVFTTDFRNTAKIQSNEASDGQPLLWNVTRHKCSPTLVTAVEAQRQQLVQANSSVSPSLPDPSVQLLFSANTTDAVDTGRGNETQCSCWTRSLISGEDASVEIKNDNAQHQEAKWMLCM